MFGGSLSSFSSLFGGSQTHANEPKLDVEQNNLTYADHNEPKRKKTSSILGEPRRPSEFIIWQLGFFAAGFGLLGSYGLCRLLGIWPGRCKQHSHRDHLAFHLSEFGRRLFVASDKERRRPEDHHSRSGRQPVIRALLILNAR